MPRHFAPDGLRHILVVAVDRIAVLIRLHAILKHILADLAEIEIEIATLAVGILRVEEGIHHPELDILHVRLLEVGIVHLAHDAAPALLRIEKTAVGVDIVGVEIVGAALCRIEGKIETLY